MINPALENLEKYPETNFTPQDIHFFQTVMAVARNKHLDEATRNEISESLVKAVHQCLHQEPKIDLARLFFRIYQEIESQADSRARKPTKVKKLIDLVRVTLGELASKIKSSDSEKDFSSILAEFFNQVRQINQLRPSEADPKNPARIMDLVKLALVNGAEKRDLIATSRLDVLTGLHNRQSLKEDLDSLMKTLSKNERRDSSEDFCVVMVDLDHFKAVNDEYGHQTGDQILQNFALLLQKSIRPLDKAYRYGGEEFTLILRGDYRSAEEVIKRIMWVLRSEALGHAHDLPNVPISKTASFGWVASNQLYGDTTEGALRKADTALYQAKNSGRDRQIRYSVGGISKIIADANTYPKTYLPEPTFQED